MLTDWRDCERPCWHCVWWGGMLNTINGRCNRPGSHPIQAAPRSGCAFHEREPGIDDDAWKPLFLSGAEMKKEPPEDPKAPGG